MENYPDRIGQDRGEWDNPEHHAVNGAASLDSTARGLTPMRRCAVGAVGMTAVLLVSTAWLWPASIPSRDHAGGQPGPSERIFTVVEAPARTHVTVLGTVVAGKALPILAPFDGLVREKHAQLGDYVSAGEALVVMDDGELRSRLRDAQSSLLKAEMAARVLARWDESPDVLRAKRALQAAEVSLAAIARQVAETKALLDRGIVSRNEHDSLIQQRNAQELMVSGTRQDLAVTLERGNADNRRLAELDLENAKARQDDLQQQLDGMILRAPVPGVLTRPPMSGLQSAQNPIVIEPGVRVARGQPVFAITDTALLVVAGKVDEVDINRVRIGQSVSIFGDAFAGAPLPGRVVSVSAEADSQQNIRVPTFDVRVAFSSDRDAAHPLIRLGMSARMSIEIASNPHAIVIPIETLRDATSLPTIMVRDPRTKETAERRVTLGETRESGVEILSGLAVGDQVIIP